MDRTTEIFLARIRKDILQAFRWIWITLLCTLLCLGASFLLGWAALSLTSQPPSPSGRLVSGGVLLALLLYLGKQLVTWLADHWDAALLTRDPQEKAGREP